MGRPGDDDSAATAKAKKVAKKAVKPLILLTFSAA
jgi:hypothetical protein